MAGKPGPSYVNGHHRVEVLDGHVPHGPVPHDAGIVDQDVEPAEPGHSLVDEAPALLVVGDVREVRLGSATPGGDESHGFIGVPTSAFTADGAAEVVHHHFGPMV